MTRSFKFILPAVALLAVAFILYFHYPRNSTLPPSPGDAANPIAAVPQTQPSTKISLADWTGEFPPDYFHGRPEQVLANNAFTKKPAPPLDLTQWINGQVTPQDMKGKIVLIDFWATWCSDCMIAMPKTNALYKKYKDQGVLVIGACTDQDQDKMAQVASKLQIVYPVAADPTLAVEKAWNVHWWPTYAVIDRTGTVRALGLKDERVEEVILKLLKE